MRRALPGFLFALLVVAVYVDPLLTRRNFAGRDLLGYHLPVESAIHDAYARGRLPVWMPEISGGRPLAANPNAGALYPLRPLLALVSFPLAMRLWPALHWIVAGLGAFMLTRSLGASRCGAWIGAVTYSFSGVGVSEVFFPNTHPGVALLPWIVWATSLESMRASWRVVGLSLLFGLDLLAGDAFTVGLALLASFLWILVAQEAVRRSRRVFQLLAGFSLSLLIALPQILASVLWAPYTERGVTGLTVAETLNLSLPPLRLLELVIPFPFGATWELDAFAVWGGPILTTGLAGFFSSLYAGALAPMTLFWRSERGSKRYALVLLICGVGLSSIGFLVPARMGSLQSPLPLRYPEKFAVAICLALAILAAHAYDTARTGRRPPRWAYAIGLALASLALAAALEPSVAGRWAVGLIGSPPWLASIAGEQLSGALAEGGLLWMTTLAAVEMLSGCGPWREAVALSLLTLVPIAANRRIARTFSQASVLDPTVFARIVEKRDPTRQFRVFGAYSFREHSAVGRDDLGADPALIEYARRGWFYYTPALWKENTVLNLDFDRGDLSRLHSLRRLAGDGKRIPNLKGLLDSLSVRWAIRFRDEPPSPGFVRGGGDGLQEWDENVQAQPDVRVLEAWREVSSAPEALAALTAGSEGEVVLETGSTRVRRSASGSIRILENSPERLILDADCREAGWLFALRGYWPYRDVRVEGRAAEVVPAQLAFSAVALPIGRHRVEWVERLPGWEISRWGPVLFALAAAFVVLRERGSPRGARKALE
jgi:hypothetical protein